MEHVALPSWVFANPAVSILLPISLGSLVGYSTRHVAIEVENMYLAIKQPPLRPPPWVFGPVWVTLYGLMGYAAHRAWVAGSASTATAHTARVAAGLYTAQLAVNLAWMPLFFGMRRPVAATVDIVALVGMNVYLTQLYARLDTAAAWCMAPYVAWITFATYLCAGTGYLNHWDFSPAKLAERKDQ